MTTPIPTITLNNGVEMPQVGFGVFQVPNEETTAAVGSALKAGYRSIDTAAIYGNEEGVGAALAQSGIAREDLFITSKIWIADMGYEQALEAFDASLERLGLDYLDLYLIHWPAPEKNLYVETWKALEKLYAEKKIRAIGVSNFQPEHLEQLVAEGTIVPAVNQVELHPALQNREVVAANAQHGIVTEAWSPLAQGAMLTDETIVGIARAHEVSAAQVILRWHLQQGRVIIPKSVTESRIIANLNLFGFKLTSDELASIDALDRDGRTGPNPDTFNG
ncbi:MULTISPECIES: aldo/keto reductase [unclassified Arthrobacter]|uniref:aldo/keto reductase n=2 Tax=Micrococcaceae TaxID=1268 RepID=UPI000CFCC883|nr:MULTISPECIES: aldo/keto reductase [unclassified Arthrobacter]PQZ88276.1 2,5-diketo-D-gluconic acid reductase [Arthrobacter sp. MYb222]PRB76818.1 2,5-diketo-D-gluconic acid reductase [Arthrobacter sp. MYb214]TDU30304.1 2,5-diketo-D-gluconate reductase A [Arthrobacter sp. JUb115]